MVSCLMGDSTALASAIVRCCPKLPAATIKVVCEADQEDELDEGDLNEILGGAITVQCISEEQHDYKILTADNLLENAYSVTNVY